MKSNFLARIRTDKDWIIQIIIYAMIFIIGLFYIEISEYLLVLGILVIFLSIKKGTVEFTFENILLFVTFLSYVIIDYFHHIGDLDYDYVDNFFLIIDSSLGYFIGYHLLKNNPSKAQIIFKRVSFIVVFSTGLFAILGLIFKWFAPSDFIEYLKQTDQDSFGRWGYDVWAHEVVYPTNFNNQFTFAMASVFGILFYIRNLPAKILLGLILVASIWSAFATSTRTNIYLILIMLGLGFVFDIFFNQSQIVKSIGRFTRRYKIAFGLSLGVLILAIPVFGKNVATKIFQSDLVNRFSHLNNERLLNGRMYLSLDVMRNIPNFPFGNMKMYWAHNLWLDVARISGIVPMSFLLIYSFVTFISIVKLMKNRLIDIRIRLMSVSAFIGTYFSFAIEPIIEGRPHLWMFFCLFNGMIFYLSRMSEEKVI